MAVGDDGVVASAVAIDPSSSLEGEGHIDQDQLPVQRPVAAAAGDEVHTDAYRDVVVASVVVVDTVGNLDEDRNWVQP